METPRILTNDQNWAKQLIELNFILVGMEIIGAGYRATMEPESMEIVYLIFLSLVPSIMMHANRNLLNWSLYRWFAKIASTAQLAAIFIAALVYVLTHEDVESLFELVPFLLYFTSFIAIPITVLLIMNSFQVRPRLVYLMMDPKRITPLVGDLRSSGSMATGHGFQNNLV
uniref:Uncharacterized protein n=1 Tax=Euplotes crassus TaxID=5936 RepID=A0A7S3KN36_EUPCR|mmetsp:Transcript_3628/g.3373  ORF Transcript_3628/g.3373 Transcript_3628/m.3373 type:complete len:171 (+) Transcript_3628:23-535(+)